MLPVLVLTGPHWHWHLDIQPSDGIPFCGVKAIEIVLVVIPIKCFEVQDVRPIKGQYHVNVTAIWKSIPGELNGNVIKFLSTKKLLGFKSVCKNAKSSIESGKGLLFDAIRERLDKIIEECGFECVPNAF